MADAQLIPDEFADCFSVGFEFFHGYLGRKIVMLDFVIHETCIDHVLEERVFLVNGDWGLHGDDEVLFFLHESI